MTDDTYDIVQSDGVDQKFYTFSDADLKNLEYYVNQQNLDYYFSQQNHLNSEQDDDDDDDGFKTVDGYANQTLINSLQPLPDIYPYIQTHVKNVHQEPITPMPFNGYNTLPFKVAPCSVEKNASLPIPPQNVPLAHENFADDTRHATEKAQHIFLGNSDNTGGNIGYKYNPHSFCHRCSNFAHRGAYAAFEPKHPQCHAVNHVQTENYIDTATSYVLGFDHKTGRLCSVSIGGLLYLII